MPPMGLLWGATTLFACLGTAGCIRIVFSPKARWENGIPLWMSVVASLVGLVAVAGCIYWLLHLSLL